ncbi:MAG: APC family permease, partial [Chlamydiales bacterium]|nr:APC family permease [Chlamydiales bacterium]
MTEVNQSKHSFKFDKAMFHKISLLPFFAFVGLGSDPLSSSCYGPEEAFIALGNHPHLIIFVGLLAIFTIWTISTSYSQIIDLFPYGGGGYVVGTKLLTPTLGLISGCALLVDYVLTITISVASGVDAFFSILPHEHQIWKFSAKIGVLFAMLGLNLRGVKESVFPWVPVFILFIVTHAVAILWAFFSKFEEFPFIAHGAVFDVQQATESLGVSGMLLLILKSYSVGSGTYTGIEAVSNGMNLFRPPRTQNAKITMLYMAVALALLVSGLILSYLLYDVSHVTGFTLNSILMHKIGAEMGPVVGSGFAAVTLFSEAALLFIAAQSGFLSGPRVLANMAADRWLPNRFTNLSDHFVMRHGILLISLAAASLMVYSFGSVSYLVVLYSLAVFLTFTITQLGMVRHWSLERLYNRKWLKGMIINGIGCCLTFFILISLSIIKFEEGAWLTLLVISLLVFICKKIKAYYTNFAQVINALPVEIPPKEPTPISEDYQLERTHTAVLFVSSVTSPALQCIAQTIKFFGKSINHFVFIRIGIIDAGSFKGGDEVQHLEEYIKLDSIKLVKMMEKLGYSAESQVSVGLDISEEAAKNAEEVRQRHPSAIFVGGQVVLAKETTFSHWMHNQT